ncbi:MAG: integration host factor subunit beta [Candidatus Hydrogenedentes bacterium]|nr:integration host factor subunit beta [Candidatus Hydrogenedentota bacterium]
MTKRELVISVAEQLGFTQNEVSDVVQTTLDTITEALSSGDRLEIRNFGVFEVKVRDARLGRNPRTGDSVPIAEKRIPIFKPGKALKEWVEKADPTATPPSVGERQPEDAPNTTGSAF